MLYGALFNYSTIFTFDLIVRKGLIRLFFILTIVSVVVLSQNSNGVICLCVQSLYFYMFIRNLFICISLCKIIPTITKTAVTMMSESSAFKIVL